MPVRTCLLGLSPHPHPFEQANGPAIAANWQAEIEDKPALFDGRMVLLSELSLREGALEGTCHEVGFSTFLYWRRVAPVEGTHHIFAYAVPVTRDGALVAVRMGAHTANAGQVYFAAGSFEPSEFPGGRADIMGNMEREVAEETGIELAKIEHEPLYHVLVRDEGIVIMRRFFFTEDAETIAARVSDHVAAESEPEIDGPVVIRANGPRPDDLAPHMPGLIDWHFADPPRG